MKNLDLTAAPWPDYELLDSGENERLERYGKYVIVRPETQALWRKAKPEEWAKADARFEFEEGKGKWSFDKAQNKSGKELPESWELSWEKVRFTVRLTSFKHTGIFPEQASNWEWLRERVSKLQGPEVLNLFGYTGLASIVAAQAGAQVTHVDASKQSNEWAKKNAELSGVPESGIRYLLDDTLKFAERDVRRGASYEGIILDPPAFGRGPKGEVWKIEEDLSRLLAALEKMLSKKPGAFFLLNGYAAGYSAQSFLQAVEGVFGKSETGEYGELRIAESDSERVVPCGIYVRFVR